MIPFYRPPAVPFDEIIVDFAQILDSKILSNGENCRQLEDEVRKIHKVDYAFVCSSGTSAMELLLKNLGVKRVILPSFTWKSIGTITETYNRSWMDIDRETWLAVPPGEILKSPAIENCAMIIQHTFGSLHDISDWAYKCGAFIVHDAAYSMGMQFPVNDGAVISLSPTKIVTGAEGGIILTNDSQTLDNLMELRDTCSRLSEFNVVLALYHLQNLKKNLERRKQIFEHYRKTLPFEYQKIPINTTYGYYGMLLPSDIENWRFHVEGPVYKIGEVECRVRYTPLKEGLIDTDYVGSHILCLPCYCDVDEKKVAEIVGMELSK